MTRASAAVAGQRFRQRKLATKVPLQVIREDDLDKTDVDPQNTQKFDSGVEKHEESVCFHFSSLRSFCDRQLFPPGRPHTLFCPSLLSHTLRLTHPAYSGCVCWSLANYY